MAKQDPIHILLVEDDDNDIRITQRALKRGRMENTVSIVRDGQEALDCIYRRPPFDTDAHRIPGLILLDINLPKLNGMDVLRTIKQDPARRQVPVLMLTTSTRRGDVAAAYSLGANGFICKPIQFARFVQVITDINEYWNVVGRVPGA